MRIVKYFLIVILPTVVILGNFQFLIFNFNFYQKLYEKTGVYQSFANGKVVNATKNLFGYFRGKNSLDHNFFSSQAALHLADVKTIINFSTNFFYLTFAIVLILIALLIKKKSYRQLFEAFLISSVFIFVSILLIAMGLLSSFDFLFTKFHQVLFTNNLWLFPPDDNLIKLFPTQFFVIFADKLVVNILITSTVIALCTLVISKKLRLKLNHNVA